MTANGHQSLDGRRVLVTGAAKRVGRAIALALGRRGATVGVHYHRSEREAEATRDEIANHGGKALCLKANLADRQAARQLVLDTVAHFGGLDLLVLNAAMYERVSVDDVDDSAWDRMLELNLTSPFVLTRQALPALRSSNGSIVFVTCSSATIPFRDHLPYVVSKGGLRHLMRTLALELAPSVRVNAVAPGTVLPPDDLDAATLKRIEMSIPLRCFGDPNDIARAVVFLAESPFVTGHEVVVDGGRSVARVAEFG